MKCSICGKSDKSMEIFNMTEDFKTVTCLKCLEKIDVEYIANDIYSWLDSAVANMAEGNNWEEIEGMADDMYNDSCLIGDLIRDRIFNACNNMKTENDKFNALLVAEVLTKKNHEALTEAAENFMKGVS